MPEKRLFQASLTAWLSPEEYVTNQIKTSGWLTFKSSSGTHRCLWTLVACVGMKKATLHYKKKKKTAAMRNICTDWVKEFRKNPYSLFFLGLVSTCSKINSINPVGHPLKIQQTQTQVGAMRWFGCNYSDLPNIFLDMYFFSFAGPTTDSYETSWKKKHVSWWKENFYSNVNPIKCAFCFLKEMSKPDARDNDHKGACWIMWVKLICIYKAFVCSFVPCSGIPLGCN